MSISVTQGQVLTANITYSGALNTDDAYLIIYQNNIPQYSFLSKENEAEKKLTISAGVGYSFTLSGNKTRFLKDVSTYKLYRNNVLIASGTITITVTEDVPSSNKIVQANYFICNELPELSLFADGTIVSVAGVLYVKKDGAWEGVGASPQTLTFTASSLGTAGNETAFIHIDPEILDEYSLYKIDAYAEGLYEGNKMYLLHQGHMIVRERNDVNTYLPSASNQTPQALLTFGGIGEAGQVTFYVGAPLDFTLENYSGNEVKVFMKLTKIMSIA